jgi:hypothetical protein
MNRYKDDQLYTTELISHMSIPIEDLERTRAMMERHGASMQKIRSPDNWWTIFFPDGTMKIRDRRYEESTRHKILFPDGFWFMFDQAIFRRDGTYQQFPVLHINLSGGEEKDAGAKTRETIP